MSKQDLEAIYFRTYGTIVQTMLNSDPRLTLGDGDAIMVSLARALPAYGGNHDDESFTAWALETLETTAWITGTYRECGPSVRWGVRKILANCEYDDPESLVADVTTDTWLWVLENHARLREQGSASLRTRLTSRAIWQARARLKRERIRFSSVARHIEQGGVLKTEVLSDAELAETRYLEGEGVAA